VAGLRQNGRINGQGNDQQSQTAVNSERAIFYSKYDIPKLMRSSGQFLIAGGTARKWNLAVKNMVGNDYSDPI